MSFEERLQNYVNKLKTSLTGSVVSVIFKGDKFSGFTKSSGVVGESLPFAETDQDLSHVHFNVSDVQTDPQWGDKITLDEEDRLIKNARKDSSGVTWMIDHAEYYGEWAWITGSLYENDVLTEVNDRFKVRIIDPNTNEFARLETDSTEQKEYVVCLRQSDWIYDTPPEKGFLIDVEDSIELYVKQIEIASGDYRLSCREAGGD